MKKIINGFRYDTDKATEIGTASSHYPCNDFHHWEEALYVTKRAGKYFIAGSGGPMSHWSKPCGQNSWGGSSGIRPLEKGDAFEWASQNLDTETVEEFFSDMIEDA